ncbi:hypothetical protein [Carboxylicivirga sp. RSCT41]|uniref:hypothetical protein n=1 Tax=Carboxylicivirga agarovorans TaxID=3417570 RepID=UPI003D332B93
MRLLITILKTTITTKYHTIRAIQPALSQIHNFRIVTFLVLLCLSLRIDVVAQQKSNKEEEGIKPGKRKAVLILSDGRTIELSANDSLNYSKEKELISKSDSTKAKPLAETQSFHQPAQQSNSNIAVKGSLKKRVIK